MKRYKRKFNAIDWLWKKYSEYVLNLCCQKTKELSLAKDIRQEVFLKVVRKLHTFKGKSSVKTWLHTITNRCCVDNIKAVKRNEDIRRKYSSIYSAKYSCEYDIASDCKLSWNANDFYEPTYCPVAGTLFELHFKEGWSFLDLSVIFDFSPTVIKKKIYSCLNTSDDLKKNKNK